MRKVLLLIFACGIGAKAITAQTIQINKDNRTIAITTNGEASEIADIAIVSVGYTVYGKDKDLVYADGSIISNAVVDALHKAGITDRAISSNDQSITPIQDEDKRFAQGIRFKLHQSWSVTVDSKDAANVLHLAVQAGANDAGDVSWRLSDQRSIEAKAAKEALSHAREIAQQMADGLNAKLGPLVYASNQTPPRGLAALLAGQRMTFETSTASVSSRKVGPLVIKPERVRESATVYAVFAIEP
ncbi:MAG: SIMPL domain-containing protein [Acidobacteria bacterium]|nr:SIMPL domain-containing protein [Acidobacteriota bacterium]